MTSADGSARIDSASDSDRDTHVPAGAGGDGVKGRPVMLAANTVYRDVIDVLFLQHAVESGYTTFIGSSWTSGRDIAEAWFDRIASASYDYNGAEEILARVAEGLAHVIVRERSVTVRAAARDRTSAERVTAHVRELLAPDERREGFADLTIWWWSPHIGNRLTRQLPSPVWHEIELNYTTATRKALHVVTEWTHPPVGGRLLLWHGEPGTGKTFAVRALADAWHEWATVHVVTDPEEFLSIASYMFEVITGKRERDQRADRWRVVVLEDAGEFLTPDAKAATGQALSRLLNLADGALGQALNTLLLITTNESIRQLHPALSRPGRCLSEIAFGTLDRDEIVAWSQASKIAPPSWSSATIAELYAYLDGRPIADRRSAAVGFAG